MLRTVAPVTKVGRRKAIHIYIPGKGQCLVQAAFQASLTAARRPAESAPRNRFSGEVDCTATMYLSFANFILPLFNIFFPPNVPQHPISSKALTFQLRHFHAVTPSAHVYFADAPSPSTLNADTQALSISTAPVRTARPIHAATFSEARTLSMRAQCAVPDWEDQEIPGPDVSKRETLLLLAKMTSNAYTEPDTKEWYNLTDEWGIVRSLGSSVLHS